MKNLYGRIMDRQYISHHTRNQWLKDFRNNVVRLAKEKKIRKSEPLNQPTPDIDFPSPRQTEQYLRQQQDRYDILIPKYQKQLMKELEIAKSIHAAIIDLHKLNVKPAEFEQLAASFNHKMKRMASDALLVNDPKLVSDINALNIPIEQYKAILDKGKAELYEPAEKKQEAKPDTKQKRHYLTKAGMGLFNSSPKKSNQTDNKNNKPDAAQDRKNTKK
jgi:hypothetical protein